MTGNSLVCKIGYSSIIASFAERDRQRKEKSLKVDKLMERTFANVDASLERIGGGGAIERTLGCIAMLHTYIVEQETRLTRVESMLAKLTAGAENK
jgi:hypothetical protein